MSPEQSGKKVEWSVLLQKNYEKFKEQILKALEFREIPEEAREWILKCIDYNLPGGKQNRASAFLHSFHTLQSDHRKVEKMDIENLVCIAWCVELLQTFFLIADDLMDHAIMRRGRKCWHREPSIGLTALNDVLLLQTTLYCLLDDLILQSNSPNKELLSYRVQKLFQEVTLKTEVGQYFDLKTLPPNQESVDIKIYTWQRVQEIATLKTAYYSFYLPVALACVLLDKSELLTELEVTLLPLGVFFQAQDDYLDVYGDPVRIGKIGSDIEEGKCSWLVLKALELSDDTQKSIIAEHYGKKNEESILKIKDLFYQLHLDAYFMRYEKEFKRQFQKTEIDPQLQAVVDFFAGKIFHRQS